jgi:putative FmdB family regulatory protein
MPLYEYQCDQCGDLFEVVQKFSDEPLKLHDKCGGAVRRILSAPALQFKGSGWYITDYAKGGSTKNNESGNGKASADSSGSKESSSTTKTESKSSTAAPSTSGSEKK